MFILERYDTYLLQLMHLLLMHMIQSAHYSFLGSIFLYWSWPFVVFFFTGLLKLWFWRMIT